MDVTVIVGSSMAGSTTLALRGAAAVSGLYAKVPFEKAGVDPSELYGSSANRHSLGREEILLKQFRAPVVGTGRRFDGRRIPREWGHARGRIRCCAINDELSGNQPNPSCSNSTSYRLSRTDPMLGLVQKERKRDGHRQVLHLARLGPRRRAKLLAGSPGSRAWKRVPRKPTKIAESGGRTIDAGASALPAIAPLLDGIGQAKESSEWVAAFTTSEPPHATSPPSAAYPALAAFLALDRSQPLMQDGFVTPSPDTALFYTSPCHFPASQALRLEDMPPGVPSQSESSSSDDDPEDGLGVWRETAQVALPVVGLVAATVLGTLFSRRTTVPRLLSRLLPRLVLPRLAMRALAYPALFLQTGMLASEQGAEKARQVALWSLPPALLVSSCFMGWRVAAASSVALLTAQMVNVDVSERLPRTSHWWKVVLVAAAAASVVDALLFSRISSTTRGLALSMALVGDFGRVGARRSGSSLRPALKKQAAIEMEGEVAKALPNAMFQVALDNGCQVLAHISGKIRRNRIEIYQGDRVKVEISPYDLTRGRITHRNRRTGQGSAPPGGQAASGNTPSSA